MILKFKFSRIHDFGRMLKIIVKLSRILNDFGPNIKFGWRIEFYHDSRTLNFDLSAKYWSKVATELSKIEPFSTWTNCRSRIN
jgi:hypothetical protein